VENALNQTLEPKDKLDTAAVVNGPEGEIFDWSAVDWPIVEGQVKRLRQRIFTASDAGDLAKVRNLQKLMLKSWSNTLMGVRRVTELNAGRLTAGVDGVSIVTPWAKTALAVWIHRQSSGWQALPVKRVFIPKANGKQRPLGIPVIVDRVLQARVLNALEPEWEARFEPKSYGFRPGRGCQDAIAAIYLTLKGPNPQRRWVLDADLTAAFDRIDHDRLLEVLGTFPARERIAEWLKAGTVDAGRFVPSVEGTPQGGVISPLLLNIALHGMEQAAGVRYRKLDTTHAESRANSPVLVRYADDLVCLCHSRDQAFGIKAQLEDWLRPRGLSFNEDKTRVVDIDTGFDFVGFNVRRYDNKLLIKPSPTAMKRVRERLRSEMRALRGANALAVIRKINPIIRGWSAYYRTVVSSEAFSSLDDYMWKLTYKWAKSSHQNKSRNWIVNQYFGQFNRFRQARWVFGDRTSGAYLTKFSWTKIVRHQMVAGTSSIDDPTLTSYWAERRHAPSLPVNNIVLRLLKAQNGRCHTCTELLLAADTPPQNPQEWEQWCRVTRKAMTVQSVVVEREHGPSDTSRLVHVHCRQRDSPRPKGLA